MNYKCTKCGLEGSSELFGKQKRYDKEGEVFYTVKRHCRSCKNEWSKTDIRKSLDKRAAALLRAIRNRSLKKGVACDIDKDWLLERLTTGVCEVTGIPFNLDMDSTERSFIPSLDQVIPSGGYTKKNTQVVVWIYNAAKGVDDHHAVMKLVEALSNGS